MPMTYTPTPPRFHPHSSWGWKGPGAQSTLYSGLYQSASPRRPTFDSQPYVKDRFYQKNRSRTQEKRKVVKQVYRVKKDNRKDKTSDLNANCEKPNVTKDISANNGKDVKQQVANARSVKSEPKESKFLKIKHELPKLKSKAQPRCPLGLSNWQVTKLHKLSAEDLKKKKMAWVPKGSVQARDKIDNQVKSAKAPNKMKATRSLLPSQMSTPNHHNHWSANAPCSTSTLSLPKSWNPPSGMFGYPSWPNFDPWLFYGSLYHGGLFPNYYMFK